MILDDAPITDLLSKVKEGNQEAENRLMRLTDKLLCRMARRYLAAQTRRHHTLQPTDVVNEYVLAAKKYNIDYQNRAHFFAVAAKVMRHFLVDYERRRNADKRPDNREKIPLEDVSLFSEDNASQTIVLRQLFEKFEAKDPQACKILELTVFEGLSLEETAAAVHVSPSTVKRDLQFARTWFHLQLSKGTRKAVTHDV
jgi:RNA polymerase sigma factor (TIGR02999 family)